MSRTIFPANSSVEQTIHINELLGANESYYTVNDIFNLPWDITYNGRRGYLEVGHLGISYTSLTSDVKLQITYSALCGPGKDIFDAFIDTLKFLTTHDITINQCPDQRVCYIEK